MPQNQIHETPRMKGHVYISMGCITSYLFMMIRLSTVFSDTQIGTLQLQL